MKNEIVTFKEIREEFPELSKDAIRRVMRVLDNNGEIKITHNRKARNRIELSPEDADRVREALKEEYHSLLTQPAGEETEPSPSEREEESQQPDASPAGTPEQKSKEAKSVKDLAATPGPEKREVPQKKKEVEQEGKKRTTKNVWWIVGGAALLLGAAVIWWKSYQRRKQQKEKETATVGEAQTEPAAPPTPVRDRRKELEELYTVQ